VKNPDVHCPTVLKFDRLTEPDALWVAGGSDLLNLLHFRPRSYSGENWRVFKLQCITIAIFSSYWVLCLTWLFTQTSRQSIP